MSTVLVSMSGRETRQDEVLVLSFHWWSTQITLLSFLMDGQPW